jgi:hypothetical protein
MQVNGFTFSRRRIIEVATFVVLVVLGCVLPYLSMQYQNDKIEVVQFSGRLFSAADFVRGIDPLYFPSYEPGPKVGQMQLGLNVYNLGAAMHQIGAVVAVLMCWSLFQDEINKFFWWPLHLAGWLLALGFVPLFIGRSLLHRVQVDTSVSYGWLPLTLAGVVIVALTFRAHSRIDTYASI